MYVFFCSGRGVFLWRGCGVGSRGVGTVCMQATCEGGGGMRDEG